MRTIKFIVVMAIIFQNCINSKSQKIMVPKQFILIEPSQLTKDMRSKLNRTSHEFNVKIAGDNLIVQEHSHSKQCSLVTDQGIYIGSDHGEWGGSLIFETSKDKIKIIDDNIKSVFLYNNKIYFLTGLAHLGINTGSLYEISTNSASSRISYEKKLTFDDSPLCQTVVDDILYIAGFQTLYKIKDLRSECVIPDGFWRGQYPNSIAINNNEFAYLGMRGGIAVVNLKSKKTSFYKHSNL